MGQSFTLHRWRWKRRRRGSMRYMRGGRSWRGRRTESADHPDGRGEYVVKAGADQRAAGYRQDPSPNNAASDAPADSGEAAGGADADNRAGDGVRGADGDAEFGGGEQRERARGFGGKATERRELGNALAHSLDDAPAAGHGAAAHR